MEMNFMAKKHYNVWNTFSDEKLQKQYLYIMHWYWITERDEYLIHTMNKLMQDRGLKTFEATVIDAEYKKAMQTTYHNDDELLDRVYAVLYCENPAI